MDFDRLRHSSILTAILCFFASLFLASALAQAADGPTCADIPYSTGQDGREMVLDECYTYTFT